MGWGAGRAIRGGKMEELSYLAETLPLVLDNVPTEAQRSRITGKRQASTSKASVAQEEAGSERIAGITVMNGNFPPTPEVQG